MVRDDAADEVGVGVPECGHEVSQLLLIQLTHSAEHTLSAFKRSMHGVRHSRHLIQANNTVHCEDAEKEEEAISKSNNVS